VKIRSKAKAVLPIETPIIAPEMLFSIC